MNLAVVEANEKLPLDGLRVVWVFSQVGVADLINFSGHQLVVFAGTLQLLVPEVYFDDHALPVEAVKPGFQVDLVYKEGTYGIVHL